MTTTKKKRKLFSSFIERTEKKQATCLFSVIFFCRLPFSLSLPQFDSPRTNQEPDSGSLYQMHIL